MYTRALKETFGHISIVWRAPLLGMLAATGVGAVFTLGYGFALQDRIAQGESEYPDVDLEQVWAGLKFAMALLVLAAPGYAIIGSLAVPVLLDVGQAGLQGMSTAQVWSEAAGSLVAFSILMSLWGLAFAVALPALMMSFVEREGRIAAALDPVGAWRIATRDPQSYAAGVWLVLTWLAVVLLAYAPVATLSPLGSTMPFLVGFFFIMPVSAGFFLALQRLLGYAQRKQMEKEGRGRHGWEHLEQAAVGSPSKPDGPEGVDVASPQATGDVPA